MSPFRETAGGSLHSLSIWGLCVWEGPATLSAEPGSSPPRTASVPGRLSEGLRDSLLPSGLLFWGCLSDSPRLCWIPFSPVSRCHFPCSKARAVGTA